jgi:hypothetical protein
MREDEAISGLLIFTEIHRARSEQNTFKTCAEKYLNRVERYSTTTSTHNRELGCSFALFVTAAVAPLTLSLPHTALHGYPQPMACQASSHPPADILLHPGTPVFTGRRPQPLRKVQNIL